MLTDKEKSARQYAKIKASPELYKQHCALVAARRAEDPAWAMFVATKARAKLRGIPFALSKSDIQIPTHCPVLGILLKRGRGKICSTSPTVDRLVPSLGYIPGNVAVISCRANRLKNDASVDELIKIAIWMKHNV